MKKTIYLIMFTAAFCLSACVQSVPEIFDVKSDSLVSDIIQIGPEGGVRKINISSSSDEWIASVQVPWITFSPANGKGDIVCDVIVDSALAVTSREGKVWIENQRTSERKEFTVRQEGFEYMISPVKSQVDIESYASLEKRYFDVDVTSNMDFDVVLDEATASWMRYEKPSVKFDKRNARPRDFKVRFKWDVNFNPEIRNAVIKFNPAREYSALQPSVKNDLNVVQAGADPIEIGVKGDSLALIAISRALGVWAEYKTEERMEFWDGVEIWKSGEHKGRVKRAEFYMFGTKEPIPFQVKYLTAAEELYFFGNTNTFLLNLEQGQHICELTQLRKLTICAYGLNTLTEDFKKLKNLEYLDISSNNFQKVPEVLNPENFPKLTALIMNACQRNTIYDLANTTKTDYGGLIEETEIDEKGKMTFPKRLLMWDKLDTLRLSVNYLQGSIPDLMDDPQFPKWTAEEVNACDTLPSILIGLPKVLPNTNLFAINLNRLSGTLPDWLLYHPKLDLWYPSSLIFMQEGKDTKGNSAGFDNEPANLDYYYEHYTNKKFSTANSK